MNTNRKRKKQKKQAKIFFCSIIWNFTTITNADNVNVVPRNLVILKVWASKEIVRKHSRLSVHVSRLNTMALETNHCPYVSRNVSQRKPFFAFATCLLACLSLETSWSDPRTIFFYIQCMHNCFPMYQREAIQNSHASQLFVHPRGGSCSWMQQRFLRLWSLVCGRGYEII